MVHLRMSKITVASATDSGFLTSYLHLCHLKTHELESCLLNWPRLSRSAVCKSCERIKSLSCVLNEMRLWLWLPVASHQPVFSLDILLSPTSPIMHPSSSRCNHPSENITSAEILSCASTKPQGNHLSFADAWSQNTSSISCFSFFVLSFFFISKSQKYFSHPVNFSPQDVKRRWEAHCLVIISQGWDHWVLLSCV